MKINKLIAEDYLEKDLLSRLRPYLIFYQDPLNDELILNRLYTFIRMVKFHDPEIGKIFIDQNKEKEWIDRKLNKDDLEIYQGLKLVFITKILVQEGVDLGIDFEHVTIVLGSAQQSDEEAILSLHSNEVIEGIPFNLFHQKYYPLNIKGDVRARAKELSKQSLTSLFNNMTLGWKR